GSDCDRPALRLIGRSSQAVDAATRCGHERDANAHPLQDLDHTVDRIALADPSRVEVHAGVQETDSAGAGIELHVPVSHAIQCIFDLLRLRHASLTLVEAPHLY